MKYNKKKPAVLLLADGTVFHGKAVGIYGVATGELCFNTGMTGYQEVFTDPSYFGQLMITTNAHIGNYGVHNTESNSSEMKIAGLICKNFNTGFSRDRGDGDLQDYFIKQNKVVISDVDTRAVVRHIRDKGAMNAIISTATTDVAELTKLLDKVPSMEGLELSSSVCTKTPYFVGDENAAIKVAVLDLGVKRNILTCLSDRDCYLQVFPMHTSYEEMKAWNPDGFFLSNGPGDPSAMPSVIEEVKKITADGKSVFGICLGHQLLALAGGAKTYKMKFGHHGANHPVQNISSSEVMITSQNHGFSVDERSLPDNIKVSYISLFDNSLQGIEFDNAPAFGFQGHPEASPGPQEIQILFNKFSLMVHEYAKT